MGTITLEFPEELLDGLAAVSEEERQDIFAEIRAVIRERLERAGAISRSNPPKQKTLGDHLKACAEESGESCASASVAQQPEKI